MVVGYRHLRKPPFRKKLEFELWNSIFYGPFRRVRINKPRWLHEWNIYIYHTFKQHLAKNSIHGTYCWWTKSGWPVEVGSASRYLQGLIMFDTSQVEDFFHQQYDGWCFYLHLFYHPKLPSLVPSKGWCLNCKGVLTRHHTWNIWELYVTLYFVVLTVGVPEFCFSLAGSSDQGLRAFCRPRGFQVSKKGEVFPLNIEERSWEVDDWPKSCDFVWR